MASALLTLVNTIRKNKATLALARGATRLIPDVPYTTNMRGVGPLRIRLRRHRYHWWEDPILADQVLVSMFAHIIRKGDVVYDVGANIGLFSRLFITWFGASQVLAFEPMTENLDLLRANTALAKLESRTDVLSTALSDHDGEEELQVDDMMSGSAVLNSVSGGKPSSGREKYGLPPATEKVVVRSLDSFMRGDAKGVPPVPQMMKIDTEGAEVIILRGGRETLLKHKPRLQVAMHGQDKARGTITTLLEYGAFPYGYVMVNGARVWQKMVPDDATRLGNTNILASWNEDDVRGPIRMVESVPLP
jgi:FkbM family methyltransferase